MNEQIRVSHPNCTARIIPEFSGVAIPLEDARILWRR